ncbi:MAG: kinase-like domain-containing protein [Monoraphidium minutum]|nr:MAG: kinase-like domain-containing protein [Monoraphidium minutum]
MKWLDSLKTNLKKKRSQADLVEDEDADEDELVVPLPDPGAGGGSSDGGGGGGGLGGGFSDDLASRPKRRSVSVDLYGSHLELLTGSGSDRRGSVDLRASVDYTSSMNRRASVDRRASLEQWHEARRQRNSMDAQGTISTDKLTVCKAAGTTILNSTYVTIKHLGSGTFGRVMLCFNVYDQRLYAIKFCRKSQFVQTISVFQEALARFSTEEVVKEIAILKKLSHPNIVNLIEVIDDPTTDSLLLVMEYVEGGTLQPREAGPARWQPTPESVVWKYVRQVLQGLDYLHANRVVHGDLKPANLLLDSNSRRVKIADFGSSIMAGGGAAAAAPGAPPAGAPGAPPGAAAGAAAGGGARTFEMDMWALGVCVYMWTFGELPFTGAAPFIIYDKIRSQDLSMPQPRLSTGAEPPSAELLDFLSRLLQKDAPQRLGVAAAMRHPWVTRGGTAPLRSITAGAAGGAAPPAVRPSQEELDAAIRLADGPAQERVEAVFAERHYVDGEVLVAPGDAADTVFLIAAGEVEIVAAALLGGMGAGAHEPLITGLDLDGIGGQDGGVGVGDLLEADQGLASRIEGGGSPRGRASVALIGEVLTAGGGRPRGGAPGGARLEDGRQTLGLKGPGDSLGLPSLLQSRSKEHRWRAFCRARGAVTVFAARVCDLQALVAQHPEMEPAVQQIATQQETDMAVAEAMRRLRIFQGGGGGGKASGAVTVHATSVVPPQAS